MQTVDCTAIARLLANALLTLIVSGVLCLEMATLNPPKVLLHMVFATLRWGLSTLALLASSTILLSCKPTALPSSFSSSIILPPTLTEVAIRQMLATKAESAKQANETELAPGSTLYPPSTKLSKPIPIPAQSPVPPPIAFAPSPDGTPAGTGTLVNAKAWPSFWRHDFVDENIWYKDTEGGTLRTTVYSGFMLALGGFPTEQGVVVVEAMKMDSRGDVKQVYYRLFPTPTQSGSVHITGAVGERLILQSTNGTTFYFDVPSRQFVTSMTVVVPTATIPGSPLATPTPMPPTFPPVSAIHGEDVTPVGAGVVGQFMVSLNHGRYHILNTWIENQDSNRQAVFVYAGELARLDGGETMQGAVVVQVWQSSIRNGLPYVQHLEDAEYLTPVLAGPVKIIDAVGERLVLQSITDGTKFYFDVPSRQFVPSMTAIVPTATISASPLATPTPAP